MDKQQIAHILEKEIISIDRTIARLQYVFNTTIDSHQARDISEVINDLNDQKIRLENIISNIVQDAKHFNSDFNR